MSAKATIALNGADIAAHVERFKIAGFWRNESIAVEVTIEFRDLWRHLKNPGLQPPEIFEEMLVEISDGLFTFRATLRAMEVVTRHHDGCVHKLKLLTKEAI